MRAVGFSAGGDGGRKAPEPSAGPQFATRLLRQSAIAEQSRFMSTR
jgi:hypothetical protein